MKTFENENTSSLFEELCVGLSQAIEFAQGTGEAKITLYGDNSSNNSRLEKVYNEMHALRS